MKMILFSRNISLYLPKVNLIGMQCDIACLVAKKYVLCIISIITYNKIW